MKHLNLNEQSELEKFISYHLEFALREGDLDVAEGWINKYDEHNEEYICQNYTRYLNLKRRYENLKGKHDK